LTAWNSTSPMRSDRLAKSRLATALSIRPSNPKRRVVFIKRARDLDWRIYDQALTPVRELPEIGERPAEGERTA
jgi:hypothetical protein